MNNRKLKLILGALIFVVSSCSNDTTKIGYVQNYSLYESFTMTEEYTSELEAFTKMRENEIDSLTFIFDQMTAVFQQMDQIPSDEYKEHSNLKNVIVFRQKSYKKEFHSKSQEYEGQIWERLNGYIAEYAVENEYDYILGATGGGSLMYAKDTFDLTAAFIDFSNNNYNGKN